jgi:hypothetical protein
MSQAISGPGFLLQFSSVAPPTTYTTVAEVKDITGPGIQVDTDDVTNQSSPNYFEEIIPTLKRGQTASFDVNLIPSDATQNSSTGLLSFLLNRTLMYWNIVMGTSGKNMSWAGYVVKFEPKFPVTKAMTATVDIKVTGAITIA